MEWTLYVEATANPKRIPLNLIEIAKMHAVMSHVLAELVMLGQCFKT